MGLNYNYLRYFKREHLWDALQGVAAIADPIDPPPTTIHFPEHDLVIPLMSSWGEKDEAAHDQPESRLATSICFDEDPAILEYLQRGGSR